MSSAAERAQLGYRAGDDPGRRDRIAGRSAVGAAGRPRLRMGVVNSPVEMQLFEDGRLVGSSRSDRIMMSVGDHGLQLVNETLGYRVNRTLQVAPGRVTPMRLDPPKGTLALNASPWAEVWVDGDRVGDTPMGNISLQIGSHDVLFRHPELGEQRHTVTVTLNGPARLSVDMRKRQ